MAAWLPVCLSLSRLRSNVLYSNTLIFSRLIPSFDTSTGRICWLGKWSLPSNLSWWVSEERTTGKITVGSKDRVEPTERAWGIELRSSHVTVLCVNTSSHVAAPSSPVFALPSIFAAISRRRESVWLEVHQSDTSRQPRWLDAQRECQSSLPGNLSGYNSSSFVCFVESGNYLEYGTMFSMLRKHPKTFKILFLSLHTHHLLTVDEDDFL